jgi:PPP family 3-phenylpropionic acid transporter
MQPDSLKWAPPFYFLFYAAAAALFPFLLVYYHDLGLTGTQIGFLAGIPPLTSLFSATLWGALSDVTQRHKASLLIAISGAILLALAVSVFKVFAWLIPVVILFAFFYSPIMPLVDNTTLGQLGGRKEHYGRIRLWGAIGWGVAAPVVGWLIESDGMAWSFWSYSAMMALGLLIALKVPVTGRTSAVFRDGVRKFLRDPRWAVFLIVAFSGGMTLSIIHNFLFIYLHGLGAGGFLLGLTLTAATLSELPVLYFSDRLLHRWDAQRLMGAAMLFFAIRVLAYSFIGVPWLALPIQLLHGLTFSLMWVSGVSYANEISPAGLGATAQGLFSGVILGIGSAAGAFLGGLMFDQIGLVSMFRITALGSLLVFGFMLLVENINL